MSLDKLAVTPVLPVKLLMELAKFVKFVERTEALIDALLLTPCLLFRVNEISPSYCSSQPIRGQIHLQIEFHL